MTATTQTEAQRLADDIDSLIGWLNRRSLFNVSDDVRRYQAELRRLDALVAGLEAVYKEAMESLKLTAAERDQLREQVEQLKIDLDDEMANGLALDHERTERIKAQGEAKQLAKMLDEARAQVERLQGGEAVAWQDIETAPKDSTSILIYCPRSERKPVCEAWWAIAYEGDVGGHWQTPIGPNGRGYTILPTSPTHWMPLPPPPVCISKDGGEVA